MEITEATGQDIIKNIGGRAVKARRLTMAQMGELASRKQQTDANNIHVQTQALVDAGVKPDQLPAVIRELTRAPSYAETLKWVLTTEGAIAALETAGVDLDGIDENHEEAHYLALDCVGIEYEREGVEADGGPIPFLPTCEGSAT